MEIKLLEKEDIHLMREVLEDDGMSFDEKNIITFINTPNNYGFIAKNDDERIVGFSYCYSLVRPDGRVMFYMHSIGVLPAFQDCGIGTKMLEYIIKFAKDNGMSEVFVITDRGNARACHVYEKVGFLSEIPDEVCYVNEFNKEN